MRKISLKTEKIAKLLFVSSIVVFSLSIGFKLLLCGSLAIKNVELEQAFNDKKFLEEKISKLSFIDSKLSSISLVETKARKLGFIEMTGNILSLNVNEPVQVAALNQ